MINDVLDFSKIEAGKLNLEMSEFDPRELLGNVVRTVAIHAHQKGLELLADLDGGASCIRRRDRAILC